MEPARPVGLGHGRDSTDEIRPGVDVDAGLGVTAGGWCALYRHARVGS